VGKDLKENDYSLHEGTVPEFASHIMDCDKKASVHLVSI
jgi:hypothetical protein